MEKIQYKVDTINWMFDSRRKFGDSRKVIKNRQYDMYMMQLIFKSQGLQYWNALLLPHMHYQEAKRMNS